MTLEEIRFESEDLRAAQVHGLVECPHCHKLVDPETLGVECDVCGAVGCEACVAPSDDHRHVECLEPCDCLGDKAVAA